MALIEDRRCGIWNRTLAAGAEPYQFVISHLVLGTAVMILQAIEFIIYMIYIGHNDNLKFFVLVSALIFLLGFSGTLYGLCISVLTDSTLVATYFSILLTFPLISLGGEIFF